MREITKLVETADSDMDSIYHNGIMMSLCALGSLLSAIVVEFFIATLSARLSMRIRKKLFEKVMSLGLNEVKNFSTSSLITRTTNDITQIQMFVSMGTLMLIRAPLTAIWAIIKILDKSWQWSASTGIAVVILLSVIACVVSIVIPRFKLIQKLTDRINGSEVHYIKKDGIKQKK